MTEPVTPSNKRSLDAAFTPSLALRTDQANIPEHVAGQPPLLHKICLPCVKMLKAVRLPTSPHNPLTVAKNKSATVKKKEIADQQKLIDRLEEDGDLQGLEDANLKMEEIVASHAAEHVTFVADLHKGGAGAIAFLGNELCRVADVGACGACQSGKKGCIPVPARLRRAVNILLFQRSMAWKVLQRWVEICKSQQPPVLFSGSNREEQFTAAYKALPADRNTAFITIVRRMVEYSIKLNKAIDISSTADAHVKEILGHSGLLQQQMARVEVMKLNVQMYTAGLGAFEAVALNVVIDAEAEERIRGKMPFATIRKYYDGLPDLRRIAVPVAPSSSLED